MKKTILILTCLFAMISTSLSVKAQEVTITLAPGWTWISCLGPDTLDFSTAMGSFIPEVGDRIKAQDGNATYHESGQWRGSFSQFYPGRGYMYYSSRTEPVTVTFSMQPFPHGNAPTGAINGIFSVSDSKQVYFSQGNLQYQASTGTWRFAVNQWDFIGFNNSNSSSTYGGWIDLFGWGTSGWDSGNTYYHPWDCNNSSGSQYGYPGIGNLTGAYANSDWGVYNPISNGGNTTNTWRTLLSDEWDYVFNTRSTVSGIRYAKAQVNDVNGVILLPDDWNADTYSLNNTNIAEASYSGNIISATQWIILENAGAVFLPAAGYRFGTTVGEIGSCGYYWSATYFNSSYACLISLKAASLSTGNASNRSYGRSVRVVCPVE